MTWLIEGGLNYGEIITIDLNKTENISDLEGNDFYVLPKMNGEELDYERSGVYRVFNILNNFGVGREVLGDKKMEVLWSYRLDITERIIKSDGKRKNETRISKKN